MSLVCSVFYFGVFRFLLDACLLDLNMVFENFSPVTSEREWVVVFLTRFSFCCFISYLSMIEKAPGSLLAKSALVSMCNFTVLCFILSVNVFWHNSRRLLFFSNKTTREATRCVTSVMLPWHRLTFISTAGWWIVCSFPLTTQQKRFHSEKFTNLKQI